MKTRRDMARLSFCLFFLVAALATTTILFAQSASGNVMGEVLGSAISSPRVVNTIILSGDGAGDGEVSYNPGFATDPNCVAVYNFEPGALTEDSKSNNTLCNINGVSSETVDYKQGAGSADFERDLSQRFSIANELLHDDFILKKGGANKSFSICFWLKIESLTNPTPMIEKVGSFRIRNYNVSKPLRLMVYNSTGNDNITHGTNLATGTWYHAGVTFDGNNGPNFAYRIRIWDDNAGAILGVDKVGTITREIQTSASAFRIGNDGGTQEYDGLMDEVAIFNDILTPDEIDAIRKGTYAGP